MIHVIIVLATLFSLQVTNALNAKTSCDTGQHELVLRFSKLTVDDDSFYTIITEDANGNLVDFDLQKFESGRSTDSSIVCLDSQQKITISASSVQTEVWSCGKFLTTDSSRISLSYNSRTQCFTSSEPSTHGIISTLEVISQNNSKLLNQTNFTTIEDVKNNYTQEKAKYNYNREFCSYIYSNRFSEVFSWQFSQDSTGFSSSLSESQLDSFSSFSSLSFSFSSSSSPTISSSSSPNVTIPSFSPSSLSSPSNFSNSSFLSSSSSVPSSSPSFSIFYNSSLFDFSILNFSSPTDSSSPSSSPTYSSSPSSSPTDSSSPSSSPTYSSSPSSSPTYSSSPSSSPTYSSSPSSSSNSSSYPSYSTSSYSSPSYSSSFSSSFSYSSVSLSSSTPFPFLSTYSSYFPSVDTLFSYCNHLFEDDDQYSQYPTPTSQPLSNGSPTLSPSIQPDQSASPSTSSPTTSSPSHSSSPTTVPTTATPSLQPTNSTFYHSPNPSTPPSHSPTTASPTISISTLKSQWLNFTNHLLSTIPPPEPTSTFSLFKDLRVNGGRLLDTCMQWEEASSDFYSFSLSNTITSLQIATFRAMWNLSSPPPENNSTQPPYASCEDPSSVKNLVALMGNPPMHGVNGSVLCEGRQWKVGVCHSLSSITSLNSYVGMCVDCVDVCSLACATSGLSLSPCDTSSSCMAEHNGHNWGSLSLLRVEYLLPPPAPSLSNLTIVEVFKTELAIAGIVNSAGTVYCGAFPSSSSHPALNTIKMQGFSNSSTGGGIFSILISGLIPATTYHVYCTSESPQGNSLSPDSTWSTLLPQRTACCKSALVSVSRSASVLFQGSSALNAITVSLDSVPSNGSLRVSLFTAFSNQSIVPTTPAYLEFSSRVNNRMASVSLDPANLESVGLLSVLAVLTGVASSDYELTTSSPSILVLALGSEPPTPSLLSVTFSDDGSSLIASFDSDTDKAASFISSSIFPCSTLFSFANMSDSKCQWVSPSVLNLYLGPSTSLAPGDVVTLLPGVLKARCSNSNCTSWSHVQTANTIVLPPQKPLIPSVSISAPAVISVCDTLYLDLSSSTGSGGRPWAAIHFSISAPNASIGYDLATYLNSIPNGFQISPPTPIPGHLFHSQVGNYIFNVVLTNFLGVSSLGRITVQVSSLAVPAVNIFGSKSITTTRSQGLQLLSDSFVTLCGLTATQTRTGLTSFWSISSNGIVLSSIASYSKQANAFKLRPYTLSINTLYTIQLTSLYADSMKSSQSSVNVYVIASNIVAQVIGGSSRSIIVGNSAVIDGSSSFDEDQDGVSGLSAGLLFSWSCMQIFPNIDLLCPLTLPDLLDGALPSLTFYAPQSSIGTHSQITMIVYDSTRSSQAIVTVSSFPQGTPVATITSKFSSKINPNQEFSLTASVDYASTVTATWSVSEPSLDLGLALTPVSKTLSLPTGKLISTSDFSLALVAGSLPSRSTFTFYLTCQTQSGLSSTASVSVTTNGPPLPGRFTVSPSDGQELSTVFTLAASRWQDPDLPITYAFGFMSPSGHPQVVQSQSQVSFGQTIFPAGLQQFSYILNAQATIYDSFQASILDTVEVKVTPVDSSQASELVLQLLLFNTDDSIDGKKKSLSVGAAVMNSVNCSLSPSCGYLNRESCLATSQTCGKCFTGYLGQEGDSNTPCLPSSRRLITTSCSSSTPCSLGYDCVSGHCVETSKTCLSITSSVCSGHGSCQYLDSTTWTAVPVCVLTDPTCEARCTCDAGYEGQSCSLTTTDQFFKFAVRQTMLSSLASLMNTEDPTSLNADSWLSTLSSIAYSIDQIPPDSALTMNSLLSQVLFVAQTNAMSTTSMSQALEILDKVMLVSGHSLAKKSTLLPSDAYLLSNFSNSLSSYGSLVLSNMISGQDNLQSIKSNFRISSGVLTPSPSSSTSSHVSLDSPLTTAESSHGLQSTTVHMGVLPTASEVRMGIATLLAPGLAFGTQFGLLSEPVLVQLGSNNYCPSGGCSMSLGLHSLESHSFLPTPSQSFTHQCLPGVSSNNPYTCASDNSHPSILCTGSSEYASTINCPVYSPVPSCLRMSGPDLMDGICSTSSFSTTETSCSCNVTASSLQLSFVSSVVIKTTTSPTITTPIIDSPSLAPTPSSGSASSKSSVYQLTSPGFIALWVFLALAGLGAGFGIAYSLCASSDKVIPTNNLKRIGV